jgi:hypothetical protein
VGASVHSSCVRDETKANVHLSQLLQHLDEFVADVSKHEIPGRIIPSQQGAISLENDEACGADAPEFAVIVVHWLALKAGSEPCLLETSILSPGCLLGRVGCRALRLKRS